MGINAIIAALHDARAGMWGKCSGENARSVLQLDSAAAD
jgi:hypothetical protein